MPIPKLWETPRFPLSCEDGIYAIADFGRIQTYNLIGPVGHRHGAFRILAEGETRYAEGCGFLLNASGVGQNQLGPAKQEQKIKVTYGRD